MERKETKVESSHRWVCSFDRNGTCKLGNKETTEKVDVIRPNKISNNWMKDFQTNTNDKTQGQYFFDKTTVDVLVKNISKKSRNILIGCPTLLIPLIEHGTKSMLLDIDKKFLKIFPRKHFQLFNMINCHFFEDEKYFRDFWSDEDSIDYNIIVDPPFGVMINVLMRTVNHLRQFRKGSNYIFFPFFHDKRFKEYGMEMSDYHVQYQSHTKINRNKTVRVFTSGSLEDFILPSPAYKKCSKCCKYVCSNQFHCSICNLCGDRSGRGVKHCSKCKQCTVKNHLHCYKCGKCKPEKHDCKTNVMSKCFNCGKEGHKADNCKFNKS